MRVIGTQFPLIQCGTVLIWNLRSYSCQSRVKRRADLYNPMFFVGTSGVHACLCFNEQKRLDLSGNDLPAPMPRFTPQSLHDQIEGKKPKGTTHLTARHSTL